MADVEKHIGFASRMFIAAEKNYAQLDEELLTISNIFAICTDHKPLICLFYEMKAVPDGFTEDSEMGRTVKSI